MFLGENKNFYPTPLHLINKMLSGLDFGHIQTVLEPSAGKGDIVDILLKSTEYVRRYGNSKFTVDCIELDETLRATLKGKERRVIHDDFMTFRTNKRYDLIIMNPPFDNGDKHLLKALEIQKDGGAIVCLLNAETIRNPFSNIRKDLVQQLNDYGATVEYISDAFYHAERRTSVEVALVKVLIPAIERESEFFARMRTAQKQRQTEQHEFAELVASDFIEAMVQQHDVEANAGVALINEFHAMQPYIARDLREQEQGKTDYPMLTLRLYDGGEYGTVEINDYLHALRYKYWYALFHNPKFVGKLTNNLQEKYLSEIEKMADYDFTIYNIMTIQQDMLSKILKGVEKTILDLFEELSNKYHWYDESSNNIHYYNGWKMNKAYKISNKVIIPLKGWDDGKSWGMVDKLDLTYTVQSKLSDIEKVFDYLDNGRTQYVDIGAILERAQREGNGRKIPLKYFLVTFYKKGTCHIEFTDSELLEKFNFFGSQQKGWLPPTYGRKRYKDMSEEEKEVVKEFSGSETEYNKILENPGFYITNTQQLLLP